MVDVVEEQTCRRAKDTDSKFCPGKRCRQQVLPWQKMPTATFSQPYM